MAIQILLKPPPSLRQSRTPANHHRHCGNPDPSQTTTVITRSASDVAIQIFLKFTPSLRQLRCEEGSDAAIQSLVLHHRHCGNPEPRQITTVIAAIQILLKPPPSLRQSRTPANHHRHCGNPDPSQTTTVIARSASDVAIQISLKFTPSLRGAERRGNPVISHHHAGSASKQSPQPNRCQLQHYQAKHPGNHIINHNAETTVNLLIQPLDGPGLNNVKEAEQHESIQQPDKVSQ